MIINELMKIFNYSWTKPNILFRGSQILITKFKDLMLAREMMCGGWHMDIVPGRLCINVSTHHCHPTLSHLPLNHWRSLHFCWYDGELWTSFMNHLHLTAMTISQPNIWQGSLIMMTCKSKCKVICRISFDRPRTVLEMLCQ